MKTSSDKKDLSSDIEIRRLEEKISEADFIDPIDKPNEYKEWRDSALDILPAGVSGSNTDGANPVDKELIEFIDLKTTLRERLRLMYASADDTALDDVKADGEKTHND